MKIELAKAIKALYAHQKICVCTETTENTVAVSSVRLSAYQCDSVIGPQCWLLSSTVVTKNAPQFSQFSQFRQFQQFR